MPYVPDLMTRKQQSSDAYALSVRVIPNAGSQGAFGNPLTQPETPTVELTFKYGIILDLTHVSVSGTGYVHAPLGMAIVNAGPGPAASASLESRLASHYTAGTGGRFKFAGFFASGGLDSSTQIVGVGDLSDGYFFGYSGSAFGSMRRQSGVDFWTSSSAWNIDPMDGRGMSGQLLDPTLGNVYMISYQWLGFGSIVYYVEDGESGVFVPVHKVGYSNTSRLQSVRDPNLPIHFSVRSWGSTGSAAINVSSIALSTEGLLSTQGTRRGDHATRTLVSAEVPLLSVRNTTEFNGILNRSRVKIDFISIASRDSANQTAFRLLINPTLSGSAFAEISASQSPALTDTASVAATGGREIVHISLAPSSNQTVDLSRLNVALNPGDTITMTCSGTTSTCVGSFGWIEEL